MFSLLTTNLFLRLRYDSGPKADNSDGCPEGERKVKIFYFNFSLRFNYLDFSVTFQLAYADITSFNSLGNCLEHLYVKMMMNLVFFMVIIFAVFPYSLVTSVTNLSLMIWKKLSIGF